MEHNSFAYYKLPNETHFTYVGSHSAPLHIHDLSAITNEHSGFLIAPFNTRQHAILLISPEAEEQHQLPAPSPVHIPLNEELETIDATYQQHFEACQQLLQNDVLQKVVLAHRFTETQECAPAYRELFIHAASAFPKCYVALWNTPESGFWLTITPEVLLESTSASNWHTVALAGTMHKSKTRWSEKNKREQQYVVDYITAALQPHTQSISHSEVQTIEAAQLKHLRTDFYFTPTTNIGALLKELHPTPAVCGLPKEEAYSAIEQIETHSRKYYAGFSGPLQHHNTTHLYVTLRCAHWKQDAEVEYYAGGGLLKESVATEEWAEVNTKKQTAACIVTKHISTI